MDGGLDIPHSDKRFAGFSKDGKQLDADVHRKYIYGGHVAAYMKVRSKFAWMLEGKNCDSESCMTSYIMRIIS